MLVTVVQRALDQNLDLAAAFARVRQARAAAAAAGAQLLPTADLEATGTAVHQSVVNPFGAAANGFPGYRRDQREYTVGAAASLCRKSFVLSASKFDLTCPHKAETYYENRVKLPCEHSQTVVLDAASRDYRVTPERNSMRVDSCQPSETRINTGDFWWTRGDSNPRPPRCERGKI